MKKCVVKVNSLEELNAVETICFDNDIYWSSGRKTFQTSVNYQKYKKYIFIDDEITYGNESIYEGIYKDGVLYNFKPFMAKYGKKKTVAKNEGDNIKSKIPDCYIKTTSKEEHEMVQKICFKHGVVWCFSGKTIQNYCINDIHIKDDTMCNDSYVDGVLYTFKEFCNKYNKTSKPTTTKKYYIKTEQEFIEEFGKGYKTWESDVSWNSEGDMDYLFGKKLTDKQVNEILTDYRCIIDDWSIDKKMITEIKEDDSLFKPHSWMPSLLDPTQFMIKCEGWFIKDQTKEQFKLNDSLYKKRKPNLNQDN